jgi:hypothetical protein
MLEMFLLLILAELFGMNEDTAAVAFGGLDTQPRATMAINAARHFGAPRKVIRDLEALRASISKDLADRRNQAIHGIHLSSDTPEAVKLVMYRWKKERREQDIKAKDLHSLNADILKQTASALSILTEILRWKNREHGTEDSGDRL